MLVTTAIIGARRRNEPSLSSASATRSSPAPSRASGQSRPSCEHAPADRRASDRGPRRRARCATSEVVVVLPWLPGDGDAVLEAHQLGEHLGARDHRDLGRRARGLELRVARRARPRSRRRRPRRRRARRRDRSATRDPEAAQAHGRGARRAGRSRSRGSPGRAAARRCRTCRCRRCRRSGRAGRVGPHD